MIEPLDIHIGRKRSAPAACPICGASSGPEPRADSYEILKAMYTHPNHTYVSDVPGWYGFKTWRWICYHRSPMEYAMYQRNPIMNFLKSMNGDVEFSGKAYAVPIDSWRR